MTESQPKHRPILKSILQLDAHHRFIVSLGVALACYVSSPRLLDPGEHLILTWDIFALCLLVLAWARILNAQPKVVLRTARLQHSARKWISLSVLAATGASLGAVLVLLRPAENAKEGIPIALGLSTVVLSWVLIHTIFTLQYAYLYYCRHPANGGAALIFPEGKAEPDYYDFAYFSFIIGMTSQVSDVQIGLREVRCWALLHSLIAFAFNLTVLALAIGSVSDLLGQK